MALIDHHADRCVYPRPFADGFDACPAFQAASFIAADSRNKPLGTWRTCRHLGTGNDLENRGRFYPRCALGDKEQRVQWLAQVSPAKLDVVRALQDEFDQLSRPHRERLFDARARLHSGPASAAREPELEQLINGFLGTIDRFLEQNDERFRDVGLPAEPLRQLIKEWVWAWVRTPELATPRLDEKPLEVFDRPARAFLGAPIEPVVSAARRLWDRPLYSDTILQILPTVDPPGLALVGDVDRSNVAAVAQALARACGHAGDVHLDLSGLLFCDLGGLQVIVRASQALGAGHRLVLHGIPRQLERALEIVDWAPLPNLAIAGGVSG
ncbi:MAG TPA: STAS domain-containing protein [Candidatus Dormibacteraeota bacterium]|nr:STAS domain-containing protein [Candidatus Dormibacteraeota bacterium]